MRRLLCASMLVGCSTSNASECSLPELLDEVSSVVADVHYEIDGDTGSPSRYYLFAKLDEREAPNMVVVHLRDHLEPGVIDLASCPECVLVFKDYDESSGPTGGPYEAVSGTLQLSSVDTDVVAGTLMDVMVEPNGGCVSTVRRLSFAGVPELETE